MIDDYILHVWITANSLFLLKAFFAEWSARGPSIHWLLLHAGTAAEGHSFIAQAVPPWPTHRALEQSALGVILSRRCIPCGVEGWAGPGLCPTCLGTTYQPCRAF
jgi:hypothetical protein